MISIFNALPFPSPVAVFGKITTNYKYNRSYSMDATYQRYCWKVLGLNGVLFGVKLKDLGTGLFELDGTCVNEAGGLKLNWRPSL